MSVLDKVREAIKEKNSKKADEKEADFKISGDEEDKIREFETRAGDVENIMKELKNAKVETGEIREKIKEAVRDII